MSKLKHPQASNKSTAKPTAVTVAIFTCETASNSTVPVKKTTSKTSLPAKSGTQPPSSTPTPN